MWGAAREVGRGGHLHSDNALPIMIVGAGLGGTALLDIFLLEEQIRIVAVVDRNPHAMGVAVARDHGIAVFDDVEQAMQECGPCMVFNMTKEPGLDALLARHAGIGGVIGGREATFFWNVISRLQSAKCELLEDLGRMQAVVRNVQEGILSITPRGLIEAANPAAEAIFGYRQDELVGESIGLLFPQENAEGGLIARCLQGEGGAPGGGQHAEIVALSKDGIEFPVEISIADMSLNGNRCFVALVRDITERKLADDKLTRLALYDSLTGLPNRTNFFEKLEFSLAYARRSNLSVALLFVDLDGFKAVNDSMGHAAGDHLLREVARRLQGMVRESDIAARMGGDEFVLLLNNLKRPAEAEAIARKLVTALSQPVEYENVMLTQVGASVGIAFFPDNGQTGDSLINEADSAMYRAKAAGKNCYFMSTGGARRA